LNRRKKCVYLWNSPRLCRGMFNRNAEGLFFIGK
jgi:hypothetical protein